jgi:hypothetical protein
MTRILLTLALFISSTLLTKAQFKKNDILLGGQLSYNYNSSSYSYTGALPPTNEYKDKDGNITISGGKATNENTVLGIYLSYLPSSSTNYPSLNADIMLKYRNDGYGGGIFYRKYKNLGKEFYLFGEISAAYNWYNKSGKDSADQELISGSTSSFAAILYPGIAYRISKHLFLELSIPDLIYIGYSKSNTSSHEGSSIMENKYTDFNITTSLSSDPLLGLGIGFRLIL